MKRKTSYHPEHAHPYGNGQHMGHNGFQQIMGDPATGPFNLEVQDVLDEIAGKHFSSAKCSNMEQLCTTLEEAFWDYKDLYAAENPDVFPAVTFKQFVELFFGAGRAEQPPFCNFRSSPRDMADWYLKYKRTLNSYGAILLDSTLKKCVMVRGIGTSIWGFPKGKAKFVPKARQKEGPGEAEEAAGPALDMEKETAVECAIREVFEELGIDLTDRIDENLLIEWNVGKRKAVFFIIPNVPRDTPFAPQLRNEIEEIAWKPVGMLAELNSHYKPLAEKLQQCIADYKPPKDEKDAAGRENGAEEADDDDDDEGRPGHAEGRDAYPGIAFKLRRIKEGCKRCPLCGMWFMPGRQLHMARHLKTCAEMELKQLEGEAANAQPQQPQSQPQPPFVHQLPPPDQWAAGAPPTPHQQQLPPQPQPIYSPPSSMPMPQQQQHYGGPPPQQQQLYVPQLMGPSPPATQPASALQVLQQALQKAVGERMAQQQQQQLPSPPPSAFSPSPPPSSFGAPPPQQQIFLPPPLQPSPPPQYQPQQPEQPYHQQQQQPPPFYHPPPSPQYHQPQQPPSQQQQPPPQFLPDQQLQQPQHQQQQFTSFFPQQQQYAPPQQPPPAFHAGEVPHQQQHYGGPPLQQQQAGPMQPQPPPQTTQLGQTRSQILEGLQALLRGP